MVAKVVVVGVATEREAPATGSRRETAINAPRAVSAGTGTWSGNTADTAAPNLLTVVTDVTSGPGEEARTIGADGTGRVTTRGGVHTLTGMLGAAVAGAAGAGVRLPAALCGNRADPAWLSARALAESDVVARPVDDAPDSPVSA